MRKLFKVSTISRAVALGCYMSGTQEKPRKPPVQNPERQPEPEPEPENK